MSTIIFPFGVATSKPAPIAAAIGSSIKNTSFAPAVIIVSSTARSSTSVIPDGTPTTTLGFPILYLLQTRPTIFFNNICVALKSAITPSCKGLIAFIDFGVLPNICFASCPVARRLSVSSSIDTTAGSFNTIPLPFIVTNMFAVPKSIPISFPFRLNNFFSSFLL